MSLSTGGGWYPIFSPDGERVAAGAVSVTVADVVLQGDLVTLLPNNEISLGTGQAPAWYDTPTVLFYNRGDGPAARMKLATAPSFTPTDLYSLPASLYSAGGGHSIIAQNGQGRLLYDGVPFVQSPGAVWMATNGRYVYTRDQNQSLYLGSGGAPGTRLTVHLQGLADPFVTPVAAAWSRLGGARQTYGYRDTDGQVVNLGLGLGNEFYPRVIDTPAGPWILFHSDTQLVLHPWGNSQTILVQTGVTNFPHAVYHTPTGAFRVAWSVAGALVMRSVAVNVLDPLYAIGSGSGGVSPGGGSTGTPSASQITPTQKQAEATKLAAARKPRPVFPRVAEVKDEAAQAGLQILFDRIFQVEQQIQGTGGVQAQLTALSASQASQQAALETKLAQLSVATEGTSVALGGAFPGGGSGSTPGSGGGGGGGQSGSCAGISGNGHIPAGELTFTRFNQICCGTANEWSQYLVATGTLAERESNAETLIERMIWHLALGGFTAGRQRNPSLAISKDKLACVILGETRAFDMFRDFDNYQATLRVGPSEVFPADLVASSGISD